ncbi:hypothetical protein HETIRDRAFT_104912 [Heterobasidion irregulare TC 32-1]|uniref:Uncharacterized protein n=1 Tax=Heterobasidion irregulare (strain TC 32-1) TaxID=747525 RepID=W4K6X4_HETIT|nr:uncharacterized protein HETIRDRAFT_104912 [Heterobasidion irregulare TC 32-1]ETW81592.1 hypothetical protein HETIRDRAFT_104912 [Heterobasidion irregulare TC 32-1]
MGSDGTEGPARRLPDLGPAPMQSARTSWERRWLVPDARRADYQLVTLSAIVSRARRIRSGQIARLSGAQASARAATVLPRRGSVLAIYDRCRHPTGLPRQTPATMQPSRGPRPTPTL